MQTLVLSAHDLRRTLVHVGLDALMDETIDGLTATLARHDGTADRTPPRAGFAYDQPETGLLEWMTTLDTRGQATIKIVGYHPANPRTHRLPTVLSVVAQCETETGHLTAFLDGTLLTAIRTGAASAVASRILARPSSRTIGLLGCGAQAVTQLHALSRSFDLETIRYYDTDTSAMASFPSRASRLKLGRTRLLPATREHVADGVDILCTATSVAPGAGPVFDDEGLTPWLHINAVGSDFVGKTELPRGVLDRAFVCADFVPQCLDEGECQQLTADRIDADLVDLVRHPSRPEWQQALTVFDSTGWALEDHVAANILVRHARDLGIGAQLDIEVCSTDDTQDPYAFLDDEAVHERAALSMTARAGS